MQKKLPSITILLTLRNNADTIKKCIDSLLKVDYPRYEIFVVDAFSNDGSYEILKSYGKKIKLYQVKGWAPAAYNWALKRIRTEYVALIDADCTVPRNWLKELIKGFESSDVVEVGGVCIAPRSKSLLQKLLGRELEDRFRKMGKYACKVPTMNVAFKTSIARKIGFNEKLRVGYDVDFSYKIRKKGKILFNKKAVVKHYHRSTWRNFFKQQFNYGVYSPMLYAKYDLGMSQDTITRNMMKAQIILLYLFSIFLLIGILDYRILYLSITMLAALVLTYAYDSARLSRNMKEFLMYKFIFFYRNLAWNLGILKGFYIMNKSVKSRRK